MLLWQEVLLLQCWQLVQQQCRRGGGGRSGCVRSGCLLGGHVALAARLIPAKVEVQTRVLARFTFARRLEGQLPLCGGGDEKGR